VWHAAMKPRIYVDASVVGGCEDDEFSAHSVRRISEEIEGMTLDEELNWLGDRRGVPAFPRSFLARRRLRRKVLRALAP